MFLIGAYKEPTWCLVGRVSTAWLKRTSCDGCLGMRLLEMAPA